jgi:hypothetical protein
MKFWKAVKKWLAKELAELNSGDYAVWSVPVNEWEEA